MFLPLMPTNDQIQAVGQAMVNSGYVNLEQIIADEQAQWLWIQIPNCPINIKMRIVK